MKILDIESLDADTNECTAFLVKQWTNDVQFDAVFDKKQLEYFLHSKVRPMVFDVLACDTPMDYTEVKDLLLEKGGTDLPVERLTSWGDTQFKNALHERLNDLKNEITTDMDPDMLHFSAHNNVDPSMSDEPPRLTRYAVRNWLADIYLDNTEYSNMYSHVYDHVLQKTTAFWNTPTSLPTDDVIYWFDELMMPSTNANVRQRWSVEQILNDIDATFVILQHKIEAEDNALQDSKTSFINKVRDRRLEQENYISYSDEGPSPNL